MASNVIRIENIIMPGNKHVEISLTEIYGIGRKTAQDICAQANVSPSVKFNDLSAEEVETIRTLVKGIEVEGVLRRRVAMNIKRLKDIRCYRGARHKNGLPQRQRTKTNAKTAKKRKGKN